MLAPEDYAGRLQVLVPEDKGHGHGGDRERVLVAAAFAEIRN